MAGPLMKLGTNLIEAANRAEATALLVRCGSKVYRPEADDNGEDLVIRHSGRLIAVQLKGRAFLDFHHYGGKGLWMLFPSARFDPSCTRRWYLIPHDVLYSYVEDRHGAAPKWNNAWSYPYVPAHLGEFLTKYRIRPPAESEV